MNEFNEFNRRSILKAALGTGSFVVDRTLRDTLLPANSTFTTLQGSGDEYDTIIRAESGDELPEDPSESLVLAITQDGLYEYFDGEWHFLGDIDGRKNIIIANDPDDLNQKLDELPNFGGIIKLIPGEYDENDWTETITIPLTGEARYRIDMGGSLVEFNDVPPDPLIQRYPSEGQSVDSCQVNLTLPLISGVQMERGDLGDVCRFAGIARSDVVIPFVEGPWNIVLDNVAVGSSGHMNRFLVEARQCNIGIRVGADPEGLEGASQDRSHYWGQIHPHKFGVEVIKGRHNRFFVQPERPTWTDAGEANAIGYKVHPKSWNNIIKIAHWRFPVALDIQTRSVKLEHLSGGDLLTTSKLGCPPSDIDYLDVVEERFATDPTSLYDVSDENATSITRWKRLRIDADSRDGERQHFQTVAGTSPGSYNPNLYYSRIHPLTEQCEIRFGGYGDEDNYIMFVGRTGETWRCVARMNAETKYDVETDVACNEELRDFGINVNDAADSSEFRQNLSQFFFIDHELVAETDVVLTKRSDLKQRVDIQAIPGTSATQSVEISRWEFST